MINPALVEEFVEDTKQIMASFQRYADRWGTYGEQLGKETSESQRAEITAALDALSDLVGGA